LAPAQARAKATAPAFPLLGTVLADLILLSAGYLLTFAGLRGCCPGSAWFPACCSRLRAPRAVVFALLLTLGSDASSLAATATAFTLAALPHLRAHCPTTQ